MRKQHLRLGINIDHVATLRNARKRDFLAGPDLLCAAKEAVKGGADGLTFHLREDRRHILDEDAWRICGNVRVPINLEMAATKEMEAIALSLKPHAVCLVPEKRKEITTEGGLDVTKDRLRLKKLIGRLASARIRVSLFIDPDPAQVIASSWLGAAAVELHTGTYCNAATATARRRELRRLQRAAEQAHALGLEVHAGHGLDYENVGPVAAIPEVVELNIGHFLVGEAVFTGLRQSVRRMRQIMDKAR